MLQSFQQNGHGDVLNSWIEPGQNQPIATDQLHRALGPDAVNTLSRLTGTPQNELLSSCRAFFQASLISSPHMVACRIKWRCLGGKPVKYSAAAPSIATAGYLGGPDQAVRDRVKASVLSDLASFLLLEVAAGAAMA
jgi:hypothetical protein